MAPCWTRHRPSCTCRAPLLSKRRVCQHDTHVLAQATSAASVQQLQRGQQHAREAQSTQRKRPCDLSQVLRRGQPKKGCRGEFTHGLIVNPCSRCIALKTRTWMFSTAPNENVLPFDHNKMSRGLASTNLAGSGKPEKLLLRSLLTSFLREKESRAHRDARTLASWSCIVWQKGCCACVAAAYPFGSFSLVGRRASIGSVVLP